MTTRLLRAAVPALAMAGLLVAASAPAAADTTDPRWTALLGCWAPEQVEGATVPSHVICLLPTSGEGITVATIADGRIVSEQNVTANGGRREVNEGGCSGYETAHWSQDGRRVFLQSDLVCSGGVQRTSKGVLALVSPASYVDVQAVIVDDEEASRTVRYVALSDDAVPDVARARLADEPMARDAARLRAAAPLDFEDVVEATRVVGSAAVEGLLIARRAGFELDAKNLRALADAGVNTTTLDVMVALSYPDHFEVAEEATRAQRGLVAGGWDDNRRPTASGSTCFDDYGYDPWDSRYARCGYRSYYSPYGYDRYGWGYGSRPVVVVQPSNGEDDEKNGSFVKGRGYTRKGEAAGSARPKSETAPVTRTTDTTAGAAKAGTGSTATPASSKPASTGSDTGRTAKPRGGGE